MNPYQERCHLSNTFVVVMVLWLFGGEVIHNFALAMIIGVIVGHTHLFMLLAYRYLFPR
ncbi:MAG: hypothetical protein CM1200mP1_07870 [Candidatus Neomarinimicrobiota bacterium]|nr:MAG: hypothetical protein CM1200mP1_07870 [Candidatus Neomarinimicrobiota bacterium]